MGHVTDNMRIVSSGPYKYCYAIGFAVQVIPLFYLYKIIINCSLFCDFLPLFIRFLQAVGYYLLGPIPFENITCPTTVFIR